MMEQAQLYKKYIVDIIDPNVALFGNHHLEQLKLVFDLVQQIKSPIKVHSLDSIIKPQPVKNALVSVDMFFDEEKAILVEMMEITIGSNLVQWSQSGLGNLLTQLEQMRREFLPADSEYESWTLHSLVKYSVYKKIYNQVKTSKQPVYEDFQQHCVTRFQELFSFNGTSMASQLKMDDYLQFNLSSRFLHEPFLDLELVLRGCFKKFFFGPALVFFNYLNARILEQQTSLLPYIQRNLSTFQGDVEPNMSKNELATACQRIQELQWDTASARAFELLKRVDAAGNLESFTAMLGLVKQKLSLLKPGFSSEQVEAVRMLLMQLHQVSESTIPLVVPQLMEMVANLKENVIGGGNSGEIAVQKVEKVDLKQVTRKQLGKFGKQELIEMFLELQKKK